MSMKNGPRDDVGGDRREIVQNLRFFESTTQLGLPAVIEAPERVFRKVATLLSVDQRFGGALTREQRFVDAVAGDLVDETARVPDQQRTRKHAPRVE